VRKNQADVVRGSAEFVYTLPVQQTVGAEAFMFRKRVSGSLGPPVQEYVFVKDEVGLIQCWLFTASYRVCLHSTQMHCNVSMDYMTAVRE